MNTAVIGSSFIFYTYSHGLVTTRIDYCSIILANAPKSVTDKLRRVLNAASRVVSGTKKFG